MRAEHPALASPQAQGPLCEGRHDFKEETAAKMQREGWKFWA